MTEKNMLEKLNEAAAELQNIKNGIGTNDNKTKMAAFIALSRLNVVIGRLEEEQSDHQPTFEVGEYYSDGRNQIYRINNIIDIESFVTVYHKGTQQILEATWLTVDCFDDKPATSEQIATFKRAEIKNDIDFIIKDGDGDWIEIVENIEDYFQTAEELREVGE